MKRGIFSIPLLLLAVLTSFLNTASAGLLTDLLEENPQPASLHPLIGLRFISPVNTMPVVPLERPSVSDIAKVISSIRPFRFAVERTSNISVASGQWEQLDSDLTVWRLRVSSNSALSQNFKLENVIIPDTAKLYVYNASGSAVGGPWSADDLNPDGSLWTPIIHGPEAVFELQTHPAQQSEFEITIARTNYGVRSFDKSNVAGKSGSCNVDVACSIADTWGDEIRSVARLTVNGTILCSASLVNNTARDGTPYLLTAAHCLESHPSITAEQMAQSVVAYWNYETSDCGSVPDGDASQNQSGAELKALWSGQGESGSDMALLEMRQVPDENFNVHYAGWSRSDDAPNGGVAIHHPSGDEKRFSVEYDAIEISRYGYLDNQQGNFFRINDWDVGTTEGGSSGSGLWNAQHQLVGQLSGGVASCGNEGSDWYGRLAPAWEGGGTPTTRLKDWLDPTQSNATALCGQEADGSVSAYCDNKAGNLPVASADALATSTNGAAGGGGSALGLLVLTVQLLLLLVSRRKR